MTWTEAVREAGLLIPLLGAGLFMVLAGELIKKFASPSTGVRFDLVGVLAAAVGGMSFLGAGTIFSSGQGGHRRGLTTAASLLASAGLGVTCGLNLNILAGGATLLFLVVLRPLRHPEGHPVNGEMDQV